MKNDNNMTDYLIRISDDVGAHVDLRTDELAEAFARFTELCETLPSTCTISLVSEGVR